MDMLFRASARELNIPVGITLPSMGGEDFSYYLQLVPGAIAQIGIRTGKNYPPLHNSRFDADDRILSLGTALLAKCALSALKIL